MYKHERARHLPGLGTPHGLAIGGGFANSGIRGISFRPQFRFIYSWGDSTSEFEEWFAIVEELGGPMIELVNGRRSRLVSYFSLEEIRPAHAL